MFKGLLTLLGFVLSACVMCGQEQALVLERVYKESFAAPTERVVLEVARGVVEVVEGAAGSQVAFEVLVRVQKKDFEEGKIRLLAALAPDREGRLQREVDAVLARLEPRYKADAKRLALKVKDTRGVMFDNDPTLQAIIEVKVTVPPGTNLDLRGVQTGFSAQAFSGDLDLRTESGSYFVQSVSGNFYARSFGGSVTIGEVSGSSDIRSEAGLILAGKLHGPAKLGTSVGSIEVQQAMDTLKMRGDNAELILGLSMPLPKSMDLATSVGSIVVNLDRNVPLTVDASTTPFGTVKARGLSTVIRDGGIGESRLLADVMGGGELMRLRTSGGTIQLVGREPLDG